MSKDAANFILICIIAYCLFQFLPLGLLLISAKLFIRVHGSCNNVAGNCRCQHEKA